MLRFHVAWRLLLAVMAGLALNPAAIAAVPQYGGYVLGPDDSVQVNVFNQPEAGVTTRVKADGTIVMPLIGVIQVAGQTNITLAQLITDKYVKGGFFKAPVVNVEVGGYQSKRVNVAGHVQNPGVFPLDREYHALEMLLKAGWVRENGASYVYLRRADGKEQRLDVEQLVRGSPDKDPVLAAGDTLYVPEADTFYIYGQINRPGALPVLKDMTVRLALALAGGVTATGSDRKVALIRGGKEIDANADTLVQKNDIIQVKERLF